MRKRIPINFDWKYSDVFDKKMLEKDYDDSNFKTVNIPHTNKEIPYNYFDEKIYQFVSCYRKTVMLSEDDVNARLLLHFEGAASYSKVFVNGKFSGEHKGAYTPFVLDITDFVSAGENIIAVMLDSTERPEIPPFGKVVDYLVYGGIYREVWLERVDDIHIEDVFVKTKNIFFENKLIDVDVNLSKPYSGTVKLIFSDGDKVLGERKVKADGKKVTHKWKVGSVELWDIDNPKLYYLTVIVGEDEYKVRFGFRSAKFKSDGFYLNGKKIKIMGLNRHQSYPYVGYAMPASAQIADAELLKYKLGCNLVRTSHYPNSTHFLDRCDEIGLLVFTEMPSWQFLGKGEWRENCLENIEKMIVRDRNHPSVILWGVRVNEGEDCDEFYSVTNALAKSLDPTRQTGGVRNMPMSHLLEDVYTYNDFSHSGKWIKLLPPTAVTGSLKAPYLVTEYNGHMFPTKSFDRESIRTEHAMRHANVQNKSYGSNRISGAIGWCMADYNTHKDFGSGDRICYHGVTDMFRVPKLAASVYASQQDDVPVLEVSSTMDIGDHPGGIQGPVHIFTNCDYVKVYKNGEFKSYAYPDKKHFPNLPHPPITPVDFIGDSLIKEDGLDEVTAKNLKDVLCTARIYGYIMPPQNYVKLAYAFLHGKMSVSETVDIVTKYFANWGDCQVEYKFEGYKNGKLVKSVTRTAVNSLDFTVCADKSELIEDETYDVTRIEVVSVDQFGNRVNYDNSLVDVSVKGEAEVIGPDRFALIGGARAFWIKTKGKTDDVKIIISVDGRGEKELYIKVKKL